MTHLFILLWLLLVLKLSVKSNTKDFFFPSTGLVFKNETFRSGNWDRGGERGGLLKAETRAQNHWAGGEADEVQGRFLNEQVGLWWILLCFTNMRGK